MLQMAYTRAEDCEAALRWHTICMESTERTGDAWFQSCSLWQAGLTHLRRGDAPTAVSGPG